jgi:uncharacterized protein
MNTTQITKRLNIVTLGVQDLRRSEKFFFDLFGWKPKDKDSDAIVFYDMGGWMLALYPWKLLAEDVTVSSQGEGTLEIKSDNVP